MKVLVAIDSFKGSLSSLEAARAAEAGVLQACPAAEVIRIPIADGGEGMLDAIWPVAGARIRSLSACDPLMRKIATRYGISEDHSTAFIEMAAVNGLTLVPPEKRNPMLTTSFGTGELIRDALEQACRNFVVGIGGSATNDAGLGMLQALGYRFLDREGRPVGKGGAAMAEVMAIDVSGAHPALRESRFTVICDVDNPFYGPRGAAYVYAPQKGATPEMLCALDQGMKSLAQLINKTLHMNIASVPGSGAAGGLGGAFLAFLQATLQPGINWMLDFLHFNKLAAGANLVITGEGRADRQTLMGKAPSGILSAAKKLGLPVVLIAGSVENRAELLAAGFTGVYTVTPDNQSLSKAMQPQTAQHNIARTVRDAICDMRTGGD